MHWLCDCLQVNKSEEEQSTTGKSNSANSQLVPDESSSHSGTSEGYEDGCSSKHFHGSSDPLTVHAPKELERMSKDEECTNSQTDVIHALPEEMANATTKVSSLSPMLW